MPDSYDRYAARKGILLDPHPLPRELPSNVMAIGLRELPKTRRKVSDIAKPLRKLRDLGKFRR